MRTLALPVVVAALLWAAPAAQAAPPNDARAAAQALTLPANVQGTTVAATREEDEPPGCAPSAGTVWYGFSVGSAQQILVALDAAGDMDATVEVFSRTRSQLASLGCQTTNQRGEATLDLDAAAGTPYLVRVSPLENSVEDRFRLRVVAPDAPARAPGARLPDARHERPARPLRQRRRRVGGADARGPVVPDQPRDPRRRVRARRALRAGQLPRRGRGGARVRRPRRLHAESLRHLHRAAQRAARLARAAHVPAARRPRPARRLRAGRPARRRPARAGEPRRQRARRARPLPLHDRTARRPAPAAGHRRRLRHAPDDRHGEPARLRLRRARPPPQAGPLLRRRAGARRRRRQVHPVAARAHDHARPDDGERRQAPDARARGRPPRSPCA